MTKIKRWMAAACCCAALMTQASVLAQAGSAKVKLAEAGNPIPPAESLTPLLNQVESEVVAAAEAMPADKYNFVPTIPGEFTGVRSFAFEVKHIAAANYHYFRGWGLPGEVDTDKLMQLKSKDEIVKALRESYAFAHAAVNSITPENAFLSVAFLPDFKATRVTMAAFCMEHSMDHYGQLVEYLRMNGIVPPASRK